MRPARAAGVLLALAGGLLTSPGFSLLGPFNEAWQTPDIGYNLTGDIGAPRNITEEFRWNTPVIYYAFDGSFLEYFGTNGVNAIESGIGLFNALTNSGLSALDPNAFTTSPTRINPKARSLSLFDLKSVALSAMLEELGLTPPERYLYTLRGRETQPNLSCPFMIYSVIMRHFDPITYAPTPYLNGVLYTYQIFESCTGPNPLAVTVNFPVDPTSADVLPVVSAGYLGQYVLGFSRDDIGGLKYLYRTNNINWEDLSSDSEQFTPNRSQAQLLYSSNLWAFASQAFTNDAPALQALYPGLVVSSTTNIYTNIWVTNLVAYYTNFPWAPADSFPVLFVATNRTLTIQTRYIHTYQNLYTAVVTNGAIQAVPITTTPTNNSKMSVTLQTVSSTNSPWLPAGTFAITSTSKTYPTNGIAGDFFILPTNSCGVELIALQATLRTRVTNTIVSATNNFDITISTNAGGTNINIQFFAQNLVTTETNRVWLYYPVECGGTNVATLRQGMDRLQFVRTSFDSLLGRFYQPLTNTYTSMEVTNSQVVARTVRRVATQPDFLFRSEDLNGGSGTTDHIAILRTGTAGNFRTNALPGLAGPGAIEPNMEITFNRVGPLSINVYSPDLADGGLSERSAIRGWQWGSFDGSTNDPIVYPSGTSVWDIETIVLFQILSSDLPEATVGMPYSEQLQASGGQQPYTWSPAADSMPLPAGLTLSASGVLSGTPAQSGEFEFSVTLAEAGGRSTTRTITINVKP